MSTTIISKTIINTKSNNIYEYECVMTRLPSDKVDIIVTNLQTQQKYKNESELTWSNLRLEGEHGNFSGRFESFLLLKWDILEKNSQLTLLINYGGFGRIFPLTKIETKINNEIDQVSLRESKAMLEKLVEKQTETKSKAEEFLAKMTTSSTPSGSYYNIYVGLNPIEKPAFKKRTWIKDEKFDIILTLTNDDNICITAVERSSSKVQEVYFDEHLYKILVNNNIKRDQVFEFLESRVFVIKDWKAYIPFENKEFLMVFERIDKTAEEINAFKKSATRLIKTNVFAEAEFINNRESIKKIVSSLNIIHTLLRTL